MLANDTYGMPRVTVNSKNYKEKSTPSGTALLHLSDVKENTLRYKKAVEMNLTLILYVHDEEDSMEELQETTQDLNSSFIKSYGYIIGNDWVQDVNGNLL